MENGTRERLLVSLASPTALRIGLDLGVGTGIAVGVGLWGPFQIGSSRWSALLASLIIGAFAAVFATGVIFAIIGGGLWFLRSRRAPADRRAGRPGRTVGLALVAALILWSAGIANAAVAALPAVFVLVFGVWVCLQMQRWMRASRHRWIGIAADVLVAAVTGAVLLLLFDNQVLATQPAAGLLFPVGAWGSFRTWRVMARSQRLAVRAGADIALSLLLGTDLVLLLVWAANLLGLPRAEVAALRATLHRAGSIADLPWWLWAALYALLAGASLAAVLWPERLARAIRWSGRLHVAPSVRNVRRLLSGAHIGLLVIVLVGLTAPAAVRPGLRGKLENRYAVALQRDLPARAERAAYAEIRRQFQAAPRPSAPQVPTAPLAAIVSKIDSISTPVPAGSGATGTERDLAWHVGQLQATTLQPGSPPSIRQAELAAVRLAGLTSPIRNSGDLNGRLGEVDTEQHQSTTATRHVDQVAELAATAVASTLHLPRLGDNEVVQVVREYLSGLVESGPLKDIFAAWMTHLTRTPPPRAGRMVVPDPVQLQAAASAALAREAAQDHLPDPTIFSQPGSPGEPPADAAVDLVNDARTLDAGSGSCGNCPQPVSPGGEPGIGPGYVPGEPRPVDPVQPVEPMEPPPPPPDIHISVP